MVRRSLVAGASLAALIAPLALAGGAAGASPADPTDRFAVAPTVGGIDPAVLPVGADDSRTVKVMVQLSEPSVAEVQAESAKELSKGQKKQLEKQLERQQQPVVAAAKGKGATVLAQTQHAFNGVKVAIARNEVASLADLSGVVAVRPVVEHHLENSTSIPYLGVPQVWQDTGFTGEGVKVAIIDTGIDYTHADFGGPGTVEAYEAADATDTETADPALFGPDAPRIKGGWDFVGDDYDAGDDSSVPAPDPNPLDCHGHGTHVAGSTGGSGVLPDGSTYSGAYDSSTHDTEFKVGPGVAPEVDLYALRVFGCGGSTDVTVEAIDWAVANDMDVINMSLGSDYGYKDDSSSIASANAVAAGVVVVASAGNGGHNPYMVGSPSTGEGVIGVAAVDPTESYPGVSIALPDGTSVPALSANGIIPADGTSYDVVVLQDDAATAENEALGCSADAFTKNGITEGANQLAVTVRGTCARVARGVYGQQAGAAAVAMINTDAGFPPFEGPITDNPDTGEPFEVTIPFLGVRGVLGKAPTDDGDALVAADGGTVTLTEQALENPSYTDSAGFTSGGPRSGDSGLAPQVAAPGVAINSAAVGTGSGAVRMSGTSMAAPMTAGVAALGVDAHPEWSAFELSAAIVGSADRDNVGDYRLTLTGNGLVDAMQTVTTQTVAFGDALEGSDGHGTTLNFGFVESADVLTGTKTVTVVNKGDSPVTYAVSTVASPDSVPATVTTSADSVTVPAGGEATVDVTLTVAAADVPTSNTVDSWSFYEASGQVRFTAESGVLNVPYLMVPRGLSNGAAEAGAITPPKPKTTTATLSNEGGALTATMDFYTWGLSDGQDVDPEVSHGNDLRAAGVQSFLNEDGEMLLIFAINNWDRYSNAASIEHDIYIDTDRDGTADKAVYVLDYGLVATGSADGMNAVFFQDLETGALGVRYLATSPTDSSTVLAPVLASDLGLEKGKNFRYQVASFDLAGTSSDVMDGTAEYNPWRPALSTTGAYVEVAPGATETVDITPHQGYWKSQKPLGQMIVVLDNAAGADEAILLGGK